MKNVLGTFLILIFLLPTFGPWMPNDALQVLHVQQERHHGGSAEHHGHSHDAKAKASHSVHFDVVTYFSDYLHVDLKNADNTALSLPAPDTHATDYMMVADVLPPSFSPSSGIQTTGPPPDYDWRMSRPGTPVYLATQRLRI